MLKKRGEKRIVRESTTPHNKPTREKKREKLIVIIFERKSAQKEKRAP